MWQGKSQHAMDEYHRRPSRLYQGQVPARWGGTERTQQTEWDTGEREYFKSWWVMMVLALAWQVKSGKGKVSKDTWNIMYQLTTGHTTIEEGNQNESGTDHLRGIPDQRRDHRSGENAIPGKGMAPVSGPKPRLQQKRGKGMWSGWKSWAYSDIGLIILVQKLSHWLIQPMLDQLQEIQSGSLIGIALKSNVDRLITIMHDAQYHR